MSWGAQNRSKDAKTPSVGLAMLIKPELGCCPVQPYAHGRRLPKLTKTKNNGSAVVLQGQAARALLLLLLLPPLAALRCAAVLS
jgi:hypothetical protein